MDSRDIAEALIRLAEEPKAHDARPINVGWGDPVSIKDLAEYIMGLARIHKPIEFDTSQPDGHKVRDFCNRRLIDLIGPPPARPLGATLTDMIAEFREGRARL